MAGPSLDGEIHRFKQSHDASKARLRKLNQVGRWLTLAFVLVFVGFLAALYGKVTAMYAPENFEEPLQQEAQDLLPKLEPQLRKLWSETAPVYGEMALEKFEEALPGVQEASQREFAKLRSNLTAHAQTEINGALDRIARKQREQLKRHFPKLSTPEGAEELGMRWMQAVESDFEEILVHFHGRYAEDLGELEATLEQFRSPEFEQMSEDELARQFVHLWLMKVDRMVLLKDQAEEGIDHD